MERENIVCCVRLLFQHFSPFLNLSETFFKNHSGLVDSMMTVMKKGKK
jgi:hypothetical protein